MEGRLRMISESKSQFLSKTKSIKTTSKTRIQQQFIQEAPENLESTETNNFGHHRSEENLVRESNPYVNKNDSLSLPDID